MGERPFRADQIFDWLYKKKSGEVRGVHRACRRPFARSSPRASRSAPSSSPTSASPPTGRRKFLFRLGDGQHIETVLIPAGRRLTVCLSTQVGCKFACAFCASGRHGFERDLAPSEIVGQVLFLEQRARPPT